MAKDKERLWICTTVSPLEYDIEQQMQDIIKNANKSVNAWIPIDVGKVIGLYNHWKECQAAMKEVYKEAWKLSGDIPGDERVHKIMDEVNDLLPES